MSESLKPLEPQDDSDPLDSSGSQAAKYIWLKRAGLVVGFALLVGAVVMIWRSREMVGAALEAIRNPSWPHVAILLGCVAGSVMLSGIVFHLLMSRYGKVSFLEMQALIASATLMNYLPLRAGLLGRIAYHKAYHGIAPTDSAKTVIQALACSSLVAVYLAAAIGVSLAMDMKVWILVGTPIPILLVGGVREEWRVWLWALGARYIEVLLWAVRYWAAFTLIGIEIAPTTALAFACIGVITMFIPFFSNGLGLREWAIGLTAPLFADQIAQMEIGLTAELVNRGAEVMVALGLGLAGIGILIRMKASRSGGVQSKSQ